MIGVVQAAHSSCDNRNKSSEAKQPSYERNVAARTQNKATRTTNTQNVLHVLQMLRTC